MFRFQPVFNGGLYNRELSIPGNLIIMPENVDSKPRISRATLIYILFVTIMCIS